MYARVTSRRARRHELEELGRDFRCELVPALRREQGFSGVLCLVDGSTVKTFVFWETEEDALRPRAAEGADASPPEVWEVCGRG